MFCSQNRTDEQIARVDSERVSYTDISFQQIWQVIHKKVVLVKRVSVDSFSCIPPHANHRNRSEISVRMNEHSWIKPFSKSVWSLIVFPRIFSYCQIKTPLFLLKNSLSCLRDLSQLSCESHTACPSGSEGISRLQIHPFTIFTAIQFECSEHCWTHWESSFSRCLHKKKKPKHMFQFACNLHACHLKVHANCNWASQFESTNLIWGDNANRCTAAVGGRRRKGNTFHNVN